MVVMERIEVLQFVIYFNSKVTGLDHELNVYKDKNKKMIPRFLDWKIGAVLLSLVKIERKKREIGDRKRTKPRLSF